MNYSILYSENELLTGWQFFYYCNPTLLRAFCEMLTSDWLDDVIHSAAPYFLIKYSESFYTSKVNVKIYSVICLKNLKLEYLWVVRYNKLWFTFFGKLRFFWA